VVECDWSRGLDKLNLDCNGNIGAATADSRVVVVRKERTKKTGSLSMYETQFIEASRKFLNRLRKSWGGGGADRLPQ